MRFTPSNSSLHHARAGPQVRASESSACARFALPAAIAVVADPPQPSPASSPMQRADKHDLVPALELVVELPLKLPVRVVDEDEDPRAAVVASSATSALPPIPPRQHHSHPLALAKHFHPLAKDVLLHPRDQSAHVGRAAVGLRGREADGVPRGRGEEEV